jgi:hypothetical protein
METAGMASSLKGLSEIESSSRGERRYSEKLE